MGLLDDAIREHLELKRRRGADPAEVEKQEREALGPVGSGAGAAAPATAEAERPVDAEPQSAVEAEPEPLQETPSDDGPELFDEEAPVETESVSQPTEQYSVDELEDLDRDEAEAPPTREHRPAEDDDVVAADEEPEGDDVLDETPEFLQEAPEHDRLWFEQKPPRDFDF